MSCNTNGQGLACCSCGSALAVVCTGGCPDPDVVFRSDIAAMRKPAWRDIPNSQRVKRRPVNSPPLHCTYLKCKEPVALREPGAMGRPVTRCAKHLAHFRKKRLAK